ncbi:MAG TPA: MFS transporter, partial [Burkholderiaceae bacterium]|nr:MFS transporter [Burkholderiaceae bacterium]
EAEEIVRAIEAEVGVAHEPGLERIALRAMRGGSWKHIVHVLLARYRKRTILGLTLMASQAFFYNAIFFTYALVLTRFHHVDATQVGLYIVPFAVGNVLGPLLLGPLFDRIGRRTMIAATYALSGVTLLLTGVGFVTEVLDATTQTLAWSAVFFLASAAASSAYLTVSEVFPLEMRAVAISVFYAVGTGVGGFAAPALFGALIESGSRANVFVGYAVGAVLVIVAAAVAWRWGIDAERKPLEEVAPPLGLAEGGVQGSAADRRPA